MTANLPFGGQLLGEIDAAWAAVEAALPEGWVLDLYDAGPPSPYNPGPGHKFHVPRYRASAKLGILSSPPKIGGQSDESPSAALAALTRALLDRAGAGK